MRRAALVLTLSVVLAVPAAAQAQLVTDDMTTPPPTANDLAQDLAGAGVSVSNVTYTGAPVAGGRFSGGTGIIGFESGIILSSGSVNSVPGPNEEDGVTTVNGTPGDSDLAALTGLSSHDAAVLEFDFVPATPQIVFSYVFTSDEYNEFANGGVDDVFGFFVNGTNCATVPGTGQRVSINTINGGNPYGTNAQNPEYYRNNDLDDGGGAINTEMDGLTVVLTCTASVNAGVANHMKLAISDSGDDVLDSNVFLRAESLVSTQCSDGTDNDGDGQVDFPADPGCSSAGDDDETNAPGVRGTMVGEGRLTESASNRLDYAYDRLNCELGQNSSPKFAGKRNTQAFKVNSIIAIECTDDPTKTPANPTAQFDTMEGDGTGTLGTTPVTVHFKFVDGGPNGPNDSAFIEIKRQSDGVVLFSKSEGPIGAYGGGTRPGRNTAYAPPGGST